MLIAVYLFAGFLAGFALAGVLFALANRHGEETSTGCEHVWEPWGEGEISPLRNDGRLIGRIVVQARTCVACNELEYRRDKYYN